MPKSCMRSSFQISPLFCNSVFLNDFNASASVVEQAQIAAKQYLGQIYEQHGSGMAHGLACVWVSRTYTNSGKRPLVLR